MIAIGSMVDHLVPPPPVHVEQAPWAAAPFKRFRDAIRASLRACERLSVQAEEGRLLRPAFCVLGPSPDAATARLAGYAPFAEPVPLDDRGLAKLASAIDRDSSCLVVLTPERNEQAMVMGIANYPRPWASTVAGVWIDAIGPGRLRASCGARTIVGDPAGLASELSADDMVKLIPHSWADDLASYLSTPVAGMSALPIGSVGRRFDPEAYTDDATDDLRRTIRTKARLFMAHALRELAQAAERISCGATYIIGAATPNREHVGAGTFLAAGPGSSMTLERWWGASLLDALALSCLADFSVMGRTLTREPIVDLDARVADYNRAAGRAFIAWDQDTERLARLAAKDGAAFLTSRLRCIAFGTSIGSSCPLAFAPTTHSFLATRGERHRSVARAVSQHGRGTLGLCVSHDGGFTIFTVRGDEVCHVPHVAPLESAHPGTGA